MQVAEGLWFIEAKGHTKGNSIAILEDDGLYYMFHGDVTYCDAALKANKLSIVFEDVAAARETLDRVRDFIKQNPTVYLSTHCPEGYENLEMKRVMKL
jgi:glyoxylase-like metal-dependent hydrolase (beta-lactamase superfamily II)